MLTINFKLLTEKKKVATWFLLFSSFFQVNEAIVNDRKWISNAHDFVNATITDIKNNNRMQGICSDVARRAILFAEMKAFDDFEYCDIQTEKNLRADDPNWETKWEVCYFEREKSFHNTVIDITYEIKTCVKTNCSIINDLAVEASSSCSPQNHIAQKTVIENMFRCSFTKSADVLIRFVNTAFKNAFKKPLDRPRCAIAVERIIASFRTAWGYFDVCKQNMVKFLSESTHKCLTYEEIMQQGVDIKKCCEYFLEPSRLSLENEADEIKVCAEAWLGGRSDKHFPFFSI